MELKVRAVFAENTALHEEVSALKDELSILKECLAWFEKYGWEFLFVAANIDAVETAEHIGIRRECAANYRQSPKGTAVMFEAVEHAVTSMRCCSAVDESWADKLEK